MAPIIEKPAQDASRGGQPATAALKSTSPEPAHNDAKKKSPRPRRPNYAMIHSKLLPVEIYPLPAFIPHNPLSIVRIAIKLISHSIWPPSSHTALHRAYFSPETHSVHVTDPKSVRALWEQGFWGTGSLSRSEPQWLDQEKRKRGINASLTSEEVTRERRETRRQFKLERARVEREAIEEQKRAEERGDGAGTVDAESTDGAITAIPYDTPEADGEAPELQTSGAAPDGVDSTLSINQFPKDGADSSGLSKKLAAVEIEDQEHLQLTLEETFYLTYVLGVLDVSKDDVTVSTPYLLRLFCIYSEFPLSKAAESRGQSLYRLQEVEASLLPKHLDAFTLAPDNPFLLRYVVFHHFRSLGWVVRPGVKFAVDYLLYNRGPAFTHAEFAIMIIPSYSHPHWREPEERRESKDWWWLHRVNRVQTQVHKTLMLVYVEVPPPWEEVNGGDGYKVNIGSVLKEYKVREFILKRWSPNRQRG